MPELPDDVKRAIANGDFNRLAELTAEGELAEPTDHQQNTDTKMLAASGYSGLFLTNNGVESQWSAGIGASGFSGYSGISVSGASGYSGASISGASGYSGYSGVNGTNGTSGYSGASGESGYSGEKGEQGDQGTSGYSGVDGASGYSGQNGAPGATGTSGYSGYSVLDLPVKPGSDGVYQLTVSGGVASWTTV